MLVTHTFYVLPCAVADIFYATAERADIYYRVLWIRVNIAHRGQVSQYAYAAGFAGDSAGGLVGIA